MGDNVTLTEALNIPKGISFNEYEKLIKYKHRLEKQIENTSRDIEFEVDSLALLSDEVGSERYAKHLHSKLKAEIKREYAQAQLKATMEKLHNST